MFVADMYIFFYDFNIVLSFRDLSHDQGFVDEMRRNLRFMVAILIRRIQKVR